MKKPFFKSTLAAAAITAMTSLSYSGLASAQLFSAQTLGATANAEDTYRFDCPAGTTKMRLCVSNATAGVHAQAGRSGSSPKPSPSTYVNPVASCANNGTGGTVVTMDAGSSGSYIVTVNKSAAADLAAKTYTLEGRCENAANAELIPVAPTASGIEINN